MIQIANEIDELELINIINEYVENNNISPSTHSLKKFYPNLPEGHYYYIKNFGRTLRQIIDDTTKIKFSRKPFKYTEEDIIEEYVALSNKLHRIPSATDIDKENKHNKNIPTSTTIINRFGSLDVIYALSNVSYTKKNIGNGGKLSSEFLCSELRRFYDEFGRLPIQKDFEIIKGQGYPSRKTFANHFGSFDKALRAAGFKIEEKPDYTREFLISEIHRYIDEFGYQPFSRNMDDTSGYPSTHMFDKIFGTWNKALKEAGLKPRTNRYSKEDLDAAFNLFVSKHGRPPTLHEFNDTNGEYPSFWCYQSKFGSWNKTLIHYGFPPSEGTAGKWSMFENGEVCKSTYEYDVSSWLRRNNISYLRNVHYKYFLDDYDGRKDCDYVIMYNGEQIWLEIAGLYPSRAKISRMELNYKERFDHKLDTLLSNFNYKILYPQDFREKTLDEMFSFLFEIKRPDWLTYEEIYMGVVEESEVG